MKNSKCSKLVVVLCLWLIIANISLLSESAWGKGISSIPDGGAHLTLSISEAEVRVNEGDSGRTPICLRVVLLGDNSKQEVRVQYQTTIEGIDPEEDEAAFEIEDFIPITGTLRFQPGEKSKLISVEIVGDTRDETNEVFFVELINATPNATITSGRAKVTIIDDDGEQPGELPNLTILPRPGSTVSSFWPITSNQIYSRLTLGGNTATSKQVLSIEAGGRLDIRGESNVMRSGILLLNGGPLLSSSRLRLGDGMAGSVSGGTLTGSGSVTADIVNEGIVSPGAQRLPFIIVPDEAIGILNVTGRYSQGALGNLVIQINGPLSTQYDQLTVTGPAALAGTLAIRRNPGYAPPLNTSFPIITCGNFRTGSFNVTGQDAGNGNVFKPVYSQNGVTLVVSRP